MKKKERSKRVLMGRRFLVWMVFGFCAVLSIEGTVYGDIFSVPLNVNGGYQYGQSSDFDIDIGTQFTHINEVRFLAQGSITAVDAPGLFICTFTAAQTQWQQAYGISVPPSLPPALLPFDFDSPFVAVNGATWDFLLDGTASGSVTLLTNIYVPGMPPTGISGSINSAFIVVEGIPIPEPTAVILVGLGMALAIKKRA